MSALFGWNDLVSRILFLVSLIVAAATRFLLAFPENDVWNIVFRIRAVRATASLNVGLQLAE